MRKIYRFLLSLGVVLPIAGTVAQQPQPVVAANAPDRTVLHVQVILDRLGFSPGVVDGRAGQSLVQALRGFQLSRGIAVTGEIDAKTLQALSRYRQVRPTQTLVLGADEFRGPFAGRLPDDPALQAKLPTLGYANALEQLAERFHTTPQAIVALNPPHSRFAPGARLVVPGVAIESRAYDAKLTDTWRATLAGLNVDARQPKADHLVVDKSDGVLRVYDAGGGLVAQFPATMGSRHDPLPLGTWKILGMSYNPPFHYNPKLFWDVSNDKSRQLLPPGPNGPVGVVWIDLSKPHYGIHGTPHPETIGRAESHGCIRLSNWDAARLSLMVRSGTIAKFQP